MSKRKVHDSLENLAHAVANLESALQVPKGRELVVEGTIKRFEIVVELLWKTLKRALEYEGIFPKTPRDSVKEAFKANWLHDEQVWLDMLESRNTTSHVYLNEELADDYYEDIKRVTPILKATVDFLNGRYLDP